MAAFVPLALIRRPSPRLAEGLVTHLTRQPIDLELAHRQWEAYAEALTAAGWRTLEISPADDCPDSVFIEDTAVMAGDVAIATRPGAPSRQPEVAGTQEALEALGYPVATLPPEATLDGGDVLKHDRQWWVGVGGRTNQAAVSALADLLRPHSITVTGVPVSKVLHLKSAVTALPDGTVIGYPPLVDDPRAFATFRPVSEEPGAHVVVLAEDHVLLAASAPTTAAALRAEGLRVTAVDISEFEKLEGCVTCLSIRVRQPAKTD